MEAARNHVEVDSYGNQIKEESRVDTLKASTKEERLRRTFEAIDEDESGMPDCFLDDSWTRTQREQWLWLGA